VWGDAEMLFLDETMIPHLQKDWESAARSVMRGSEILVCATNGTLRPIAKQSTP